MPEGRPIQSLVAGSSLKLPKLTADEAKSLTARFNLADAHTHQSPGQREQAQVFDLLTDLFHEARKRRGPALDREAFQEFMLASGQRRASAADWFLVTYAASISMEIFANAIASTRQHILLPEPTFDNIPDIMRRHRLILHRIPLGDQADYSDSIAATMGDWAGPETCLFLVVPNNPTGHWLNEAQFREICRSCRSSSTLLALDTCFRNFDNRMTFDMYRHLDDSDVDYIVLEDTGKIWPTLDVKLSFVLASEAWRTPLELVHQDLLLNVSPFASLLVLTYSRFSAADQFGTVRQLIEKNRMSLRRLVADSNDLFRVACPDSRISVELLALRPEAWTSEALREFLLSRGIAVLGARAFFWDDPQRGERYIRIALARDSDYFELGINSMFSFLR